MCTGGEVAASENAYAGKRPSTALGGRERS